MNLVARHIESYEDRIAVFPIYHQLNPRLTEGEFQERMKAIMEYKNYYLLGVFEGEKCIAISGYWLAVKLYCGKYIEPDNVVVDRDARSQGVGHFLQRELEKIATANNCKVMMLDAYLENTRGHQFYERYDYVKKGYHFVKAL